MSRIYGKEDNDRRGKKSFEGKQGGKKNFGGKNKKFKKNGKK